MSEPQREHGREIDLGDGRFVAIQRGRNALDQDGYLIRLRRPHEGEEDTLPSCHMQYVGGELVTYLSLSPEALRALGMLIGAVEPASYVGLATPEVDS